MQICVTSFNGFQQNNRKSKSTNIIENQNQHKIVVSPQRKWSSTTTLDTQKPTQNSVATVVSLTIVEYHLAEK
jgi:hypothetical protein